MSRLMNVLAWRSSSRSRCSRGSSGIGSKARDRISAGWFTRLIASQIAVAEEHLQLQHQRARRAVMVRFLIKDLGCDVQVKPVPIDLSSHAERHGIHAQLQVAIARCERAELEVHRSAL